MKLVKQLKKDLNKAFSNQRLRKAFRGVRTDMDILDENHNALKQSTNEWVMFLDQENRYLKMRLKDIERKLESVESAHEKERLEILRTV